MEPQVLEHPVLGRLTRNAKVGRWETSIDIRPGTSIRLSLSTYNYGKPEVEVGELLKQGVDFLLWAQSVEAQQMERVADGLLDTYQDDWEQDDEGQVPMTREDFLSKIELESIVLDIKGSASWYYDDGDLFGGHLIELRTDRDREFVQVGLAG